MSCQRGSATLNVVTIPPKLETMAVALCPANLYSGQLRPSFIKCSEEAKKNRLLSTSNSIKNVQFRNLSLLVSKDQTISSKPRFRKNLCTWRSSYSNSSDALIDVTAKVKNEKILVLGGNGFVGSAVCRAAVLQGIEVVSLNRSGPPSYTDPWVDEVKWERGDVFLADWDRILEDVDAVISCIGGFGSNEQMEKINGDATIAAVDGVQGSAVQKFIFISVHDYNLPSFALNNGYFNGKRRAEAQILARFPNTGVILRPGFIYGKRRVNNLDVPLDLVGQPLEKILAATEGIAKLFRPIPASDLLLAPPVSVEDVAAAAVSAIMDKSMFGVYDIKQIKEIASSVKV